MMQPCTVEMRRNFASGQIIKIHPLGVVVDHVELGIFLGQIPNSSAVWTPEGFTRMVSQFFAAPAIGIHDPQTADCLTPLPFVSHKTDLFSVVRHLWIMLM